MRAVLVLLPLLVIGCASEPQRLTLAEAPDCTDYEARETKLQNLWCQYGITGNQVAGRPIPCKGMTGADGHNCRRDWLQGYFTDYPAAGGGTTTIELPPY